VKLTLLFDRADLFQAHSTSWTACELELGLARVVLSRNNAHYRYTDLRTDAPPEIPTSLLTRLIVVE